MTVIIDLDEDVAYLLLAMYAKNRLLAARSNVRLLVTLQAFVPSWQAIKLQIGTFANSKRLH